MEETSDAVFLFCTVLEVSLIYIDSFYQSKVPVFYLHWLWNEWWRT